MSVAALYDAEDATGLAAAVGRGDVSPSELLEEALARAEALNPALNALTMLRPETARAAIAAGPPAGPLRGVPFLLKDLGGEAADFPANNGSRLLADTRYPVDSALVARLRAAGLVVFGRTTAPEGGVGPVTESAVYGGPTRNPWDLARTPGGSSGGAGAAVAAGIVPAAHASDGGGSIRIPASNCGLFGFKTTRARAPDGPYAGEGWAGMAIEGFLTHSARDQAALLDAVCGPDLGAPYWPPPMEGTFLDAIRTRPRGLRVAFHDDAPSGAPIHPDCARAVRETAALLERLGHRVEEARPQADLDGLMAAWTRIVACGTTLWVRQALAKRARPLRPDDLEPAAHAALRMAAGLGGADYLEAVETVHAFGRATAAFFEGFDMLLTATLAEPPALVGRFAHSAVDDFAAYRTGPEGVFAYSPFTVAANASGQPAASLPLGTSAEGLPVGVQIAARFGADAALMALCAQIEEAAPWAQRRPQLFGRTAP